MPGVCMAKESAGTKQKLTAVFASSVVGYSRLMGDDHHAAVKTLAENRKGLSSYIQRFPGRVVANVPLVSALEIEGCCGLPSLPA